MSYLTLHRDTTNAVSLCGLYDGALQTYLQAHPEIRRIALCLDADEPGEKAARQLQEKYQLQGYAVTVEKPHGSSSKTAAARSPPTVWSTTTA